MDESYLSGVGGNIYRSTVNEFGDCTAVIAK